MHVLNAVGVLQIVCLFYLRLYHIPINYCIRCFTSIQTFFRDDILATDPPDRCGFIKAKPAAVHTLR